LLDKGPWEAVFSLMSRRLSTFLGFFFVLLALVGGPGFGLWLILEGDIIQFLKELKAKLPGWGWLALKIGLSAMVGVMLTVFFFALAFLSFYAGRRRA